MSVGMHPQASVVGSVLAKSCTRLLQRVLGSVRSEKMKQDINNWPKVHKDPEGLSDLNHLFPELLTQNAHSSPGVYFCLASVLNKLFLGVLSHLLCCGSNNKLVPVFTVFASLKYFHFQAGKNSQGCFASSLWSLVIQQLGFLVFIQATQVQILDRELRSLLGTAYYCLSEIISIMAGNTKCPAHGSHFSRSF